MKSVLIDLPLSSGQARAKLYQSGPNEFGLSLIDARERPTGRGVTLTGAIAKRFLDELGKARPGQVRDLIWARLGYGREDKRPMAHTMCHPGATKCA